MNTTVSNPKFDENQDLVKGETSCSAESFPVRRCGGVYFSSDVCQSPRKLDQAPCSSPPPPMLLLPPPASPPPLSSSPRLHVRADGRAMATISGSISLEDSPAPPQPDIAAAGGGDKAILLLLQFAEALAAETLFPLRNNSSPHGDSDS